MYMSKQKMQSSQREILLQGKACHSEKVPHKAKSPDKGKEYISKIHFSIYTT